MNLFKLGICCFCCDYQKRIVEAQLSRWPHRVRTQIYTCAAPLKSFRSTFYFFYVYAIYANLYTLKWINITHTHAHIWLKHEWKRICGYAPSSKQLKWNWIANIHAFDHKYKKEKENICKHTIHVKIITSCRLCTPLPLLH